MYKSLGARTCWLLMVAGFSGLVDAANWHCHNSIEVRCNATECSAQPAATQMQLDIKDTGDVSLCIYSGCWMGQSAMFKREKLLVLNARATWQGGESREAQVAITLNTQTGLAFANLEEIAQPFHCTKFHE